MYSLHLFLLLFNLLTLNVVDTISIAHAICWKKPLITIASVDLYRVFPDLIPCLLELTLGDRSPHPHICDRVMADTPTLFDHHFWRSRAAQLGRVQTSEVHLMVHSHVIVLALFSIGPHVFAMMIAHDEVSV